MTTNEAVLNDRDAELVAIGASIGAGCHPCVDHHLKAGKDTELTGDRLRAAVAAAEVVATQAAEQLSLHIQRQLDDDEVPSTEPKARDTELASLGASIGANDRTNIERHMIAALALGVSASQLRQAIDVAHTVQTNAMKIHVRAAERFLEHEAGPVAITAAEDRPNSGEGCGCGASDPNPSAR